MSDDTATGVTAVLPWRRPDLRVESKKIIVTDVNDHEIKDVIVTKLSSEEGNIIFKPSSGAGIYYIYYLPYKWRPKYGNARDSKPWNDYVEPKYDANETWSKTVIKEKGRLPKAKIVCFESISRYNFWSPMGLIATKYEMNAIKAKTNKRMIVFPEDRAYPIQLTHQIPVKWRNLPKSTFNGLALQNEYYTWQLGIWAAKSELRNVKVVFSKLRNGASIIGEESITCFNQEGINWDGKSIKFNINVPSGKVQALWCGIQIPENANPGTYKGVVTITADGVEPEIVTLFIKVLPTVIPDKGDSDLWRHSRLRWLNSTIAIDNEPVAPYHEMKLSGNVIEATDKFLEIGRNGMVERIIVNGNEVLDRPLFFIVSTNKEDILYSADNMRIRKEATGLVTWSASSIQQGISISLNGKMEFDGFLHFDINVSSNRNIVVNDVKLVSTYSSYASEYFMGIGREGGIRPSYHVYTWDGPYDSYWIGGVWAGLHTEFLGASYHGPLLRDYKPSPTPVWSNNGRGKVVVSGSKGKPATVTASVGNRIIGKIPMNYEFNLLVTPLKSVNTVKHFTSRYYHSNPEDFDKAIDEGANIVNIHHAQKLNPYINYPFHVSDSLKSYVFHQHKNKCKVKLYYTIRELSTHCVELYAFHSLNHEIIQRGEGYGLPWECEQLIDDFKPAWYTSLDAIRDGIVIKEGDSDPSLVLSPNSRFINYYLEGLRWMMENYDIDGVYLDDVSFDRFTLKRLRKILYRYKNDPCIDLHSNRYYSIGPANQYTDFFPYVDRLWFGEGFLYNEMSPDQWLVSFSGIPFGLTSDMDLGRANKYLGMLYGSTARHSWLKADGKNSPVPVWKFWSSFGIKDAKMLGYWNPDCPVTTSDSDVKATVYVKEGVSLISIGNFSSEDKTVSLNINWNSLGLNAKRASLIAPKIENFQDNIIFKVNEKIPVKSKNGWLLVVK